MIQASSAKLARLLKEANPTHPASEAVLAYAIASTMNIAGTAIVAMAAAMLLGNAGEVAVALASFAVLRAISGGYHLKSGIGCIVVTSVCANAVPFIPVPVWGIYALTIAAMLLALAFAPSKIERSTRIPARYFPLLKLIAVFLIAVNLLLVSDIIAITVFIQCLTLLRKGGDS